YFLDDGSVDGLRLAGHSERREAGRGIFGRFGSDGSETLGERLRDFPCVARRPDTGTIDATPPAVKKNAVHHQIEILLPLIDHVVAQQNFAETGPVDLHARIAVVPLNCIGAAEDFHTPATVDDLRAHLAAAGVDADRFA